MLTHRNYTANVEQSLSRIDIPSSFRTLIILPLDHYAGQTFDNSGSTIVEELAFTLSAGHDYLVRLMDAGLDVDQAARKLRFSFSVSSNYFMEIAKFRAARMLWANIVKGYGPAKNCACKMHIHAETSRWNQTVYDPYVNMLRGTTEAMSATIAGVHSLEVTPFDTSFENPTEFSKRIARNVELLLKNESHFDQAMIFPPLLFVLHLIK